MSKSSKPDYYYVSLGFLNILKQMRQNNDPVDPNTLKNYLMKDPTFVSLCASPEINLDELRSSLMKQVMIFQANLPEDRFLKLQRLVGRLTDDNMIKVIASVFSIIAKSYVESQQSMDKVDTFFKEVLGRITKSNMQMFSMINDNVDLMESDTAKDKQVLEDVQDVQSFITSDADADEVKERITRFADNVSKVIEEKIFEKEEKSSKMKVELEELESELSSYKERTESMEKELVKYKEEAITDSLTGCYRKNYMYQRLDEMMAYYDRHDVSFPLIIADLDNFKRINDTYGHSQGDQVLKHFAAIIKKHLRSTDVACRYGGEEFVVILEQGANENGACVIANRILSEMNETVFNLKGTKEKITASFGVAEYQKNETADDLIERADQNLYAAKQNGKKCIYVNKERYT